MINNANLSATHPNLTALAPVVETQQNQVLTLTDRDHLPDLDEALERDPDILVDNFMQNDRAICELHPNSRTEKGFLERHKVLGLFIKSSVAILTAASLPGWITLAVMLSILLVSCVGGPVGPGLVMVFTFIAFTCLMAGIGTTSLLIGALVVLKNTQKKIAAEEAARSVMAHIPRTINGHERNDLCQRIETAFEEMTTVRNEFGLRVSVAHVDVQVKYSSLPDELKRDLLKRFYAQRLNSDEAETTTIRRETIELGNLQVLERDQSLINSLTQELTALGRGEETVKRGNETFGNYYLRLYQLARQYHPNFQALTPEQQANIESIPDNYPTTKLLHILRGASQSSLMPIIAHTPHNAPRDYDVL